MKPPLSTKRLRHAMVVTGRPVIELLDGDDDDALDTALNVAPAVAPAVASALLLLKDLFLILCYLVMLGLPIILLVIFVLG
jgi:hypothetical protein